MQPLKRVKRKETWKQVQNKRKRDAGQSYQSRSNKAIKAREIGKPCSCPRKCFDNIGEAEIQSLFDTYYTLDYNGQSHYLHKLIEEVPVKRSRVKEKVSRRQHTREFNVIVNNEKVNVCQKAFLLIHGINEGRIHLLLKKVAASSGVLTPDKREKHAPSNKTSK